MSKKDFPPRGLRTWIFRALSGVIAVGIPYPHHILIGVIIQKEG